MQIETVLVPHAWRINSRTTNTIGNNYRYKVEAGSRENHQRCGEVGFFSAAYIVII